VTVGVLDIGSARLDARVSAPGVAGRATATGVVRVTGATVAGVAVVIDSTGVTVDTTRVPAGQAGALAQTVSEALSRGGYIQVQVLQPHTEVARDGTRATVSGGGVFVKLSSNDPTQNYFLSFTLVGGSLVAAVGAPLEAASALTVGAPPATSPAALAPSLGLAAPGVVTGGANPTAPVATPEGAAGLLLAAGGGRAVLPSAWSGWRWLLVATGVIAGVGGLLFLPVFVPTRRRLEALGRRAANLYLRG
jgi:hypothetical protein